MINYRKGVSVELGRHDDPKSFERAIKLVNRLKGKKLITCKDMGNMELNRLSAKDLKKAWGGFEQEFFVKFSYSELFFQPPYCRWQYPVQAESIISRFPQIAKHIARQIHLEFTAKKAS